MLNNKLLLASVVANVFMAAFILGRLSAPAVQPAPAITMPPPPVEQAARPGPGPANGAGEHQAAAALPLFRPEELFTREEMQQTAQELRPQFEKIRALRQGLAAKLQDGSVSQDEIMKNFAEVNHAMGEIQGVMQQKAAQKITSMSDAERTKLVHRLENTHQPPPGGPPGMQQGGRPGMQGGQPPQGGPRDMQRGGPPDMQQGGPPGMQGDQPPQGGPPGMQQGEPPGMRGPRGPRNGPPPNFPPQDGGAPEGAPVDGPMGGPMGGPPMDGPMGPPQ
jgi:uncharacterized membrane protein